MNNRVSPDSLNTRELGGYERGGGVGGLDLEGAEGGLGRVSFPFKYLEHGMT